MAFGGHLHVAVIGVYHAWEGAVCLQAKKSLWLEKAPPRQWYLKFNRFMVSIGFTRLEVDHY